MLRFGRDAGIINLTGFIPNEKLPPYQLYNLITDKGERENLAMQFPGRVKELSELLQKYIEDGRSTPGPVQENVASENWPGLSWMEE